MLCLNALEDGRAETVVEQLCVAIDVDQHVSPCWREAVAVHVVNEFMFTPIPFSSCCCADTGEDALGQLGKGWCDVSMGFPEPAGCDDTCDEKID